MADEAEAFYYELRRDPFSEATRLVAADWFDEHGDPARAAILREGRIPLSAIDTAAVEVFLLELPFLGLYDKRLVRKLLSPIEEGRLASVTPGEYRHLWMMCYKHMCIRSLHFGNLQKRNPVVAEVAQATYRSMFEKR